MISSIILETLGLAQRKLRQFCTPSERSRSGVVSIACKAGRHRPVASSPPHSGPSFNGCYCFTASLGSKRGTIIQGSHRMQNKEDPARACRLLGVAQDFFT